MRIPSSIQGMLFAPVLICLFFVLKAFCPESAGESCFADQFAVPIFLPLVAIYKIFGNSSVIGGHEFILVLIYWAVLGFLIGLVIDLLWHRNKEAPIVKSQTVVPPPINKVNLTPPPKPAPVPAPVVPLLKVEPLVTPKSDLVKPVIPVITAMPKAPPANLPGATPVKPPINLLDREEYK